VECPYPNKEIRTREERVKACLACPFVIWEEPETVAGFMNTMCGVRVGSIGMAADLDDIGQKLTGIPYFTKVDSSASMKLNILQQIKEYAQRNGWGIGGFSQQDTLEHLDSLMEVCKRAEEKGLNIAVWA
jgi:hypothetical protein